MYKPNDDIQMFKGEGGLGGLGGLGRLGRRRAPASAGLTGRLVYTNKNQKWL